MSTSFQCKSCTIVSNVSFEYCAICQTPYIAFDEIKINQLREFGLEGTKEQLQSLLSQSDYSIEACISSYYENPSTTLETRPEEETSAKVPNEVLEKPKELALEQWNKQNSPALEPPQPATKRPFIWMGTIFLQGHVTCPFIKTLGSGESVRLRAEKGKKNNSTVRICTLDDRSVGRLIPSQETLFHEMMVGGFVTIEATCSYCAEPPVVFGEILLEARVYLKRSMALEPGQETSNPCPLYRFLTQFHQGQGQALDPVQCTKKQKRETAECKKLDSLYGSCSGLKSGEGPGLAADVQAYFSKNIQLREYQREALMWMVDKELGGKITEERKMIELALAFTNPSNNTCQSEDPGEDPFWEKRTFPASEEAYYLNHMTQKMSLEIPPPAQPCLGGILADDMGMGKTIMVLALLLARKYCRTEILHPASRVQEPVKTKHQGQTLIVCPMSLLHQWQEEIQSRCVHSRTLTVSVYYGNERHVDIRAVDIVLTTYGTLSQSSYLQNDVTWQRVVLDEAHIIKNVKSRTFQSALALTSVHHWCLTGTPIQNALGDLHALLQFLNVQPWSDALWWKKAIAVPFERGDAALACRRLKSALAPILLRRTKQTLNDKGLPIISLPPKQVDIVTLSFSKEEKLFYEALYDKVVGAFEGYVSAGRVSNSYIAILALLLRLRQACDHPFLVLGADCSTTALSGDKENHESETMDTILMRLIKNPSSASNTRSYLESRVIELKAEGLENQECPICLDVPTRPCLTPCAHLMCYTCAVEHLQLNATCPVCRQPLDSKHALLCISTEERGKDVDRKPVRNFKHLCSSTKLRQLLTDLEHFCQQQMKVVVFTQWTHMLDLMENTLEQSDIGYCRFDGTCSQRERERILSAFNTTKKVKVLLMSLKAGGVGLNLTAANVVILMDPWWNPSIEHQAIDRVHRLGQTKPVHVRRYIIADSIEEKILGIQDRKAKLTESVLTIGRKDGLSKERDKTLNLQELYALFGR